MLWFFCAIGWHVTYHNFSFVMGRGCISKHGMPILASVPFFKKIGMGILFFETPPLYFILSIMEKMKKIESNLQAC